MMMEHKKCVRCEVEKPLRAFYDHPSTADRKSSSCKKCDGEYQKQRRIDAKEKDPDALREYNRQKGKEFRERKKQEYLEQIRKRNGDSNDD